MIDLAEIRALIAVVDSGSFLGAARALRVSRTTLRRQIGALEARAGVPLLEVARSGLAPTEAGLILAKQGRAMIEEVGALLASIREVGREPSGILRTVLPVGLPPHALTPLFAGLREAYPKLSYECRLSNDPLGEALGDVDVAAHFGEDPPEGGWISHVVLRMRQWLVASPQYLAARGTPASIEELAGHDLLVWHPPGEDARVLRKVSGEAFQVTPRLVSPDIHLLRQASIAGLGIAYVPDARLPDPEGADALTPVLADRVGTTRSLRVSVPAVLAEVPKVGVMVERVRGFAAALEPS